MSLASGSCLTHSRNIIPQLRATSGFSYLQEREGGEGGREGGREEREGGEGGREGREGGEGGKKERREGHISLLLFSWQLGPLTL